MTFIVYKSNEQGWDHYSWDGFGGCFDGANAGWERRDCAGSAAFYGRAETAGATRIFEEGDQQGASPFQRRLDLRFHKLLAVTP